MEQIGKYFLETNDNPEMAVKRFSWREDEKQQAVLEWKWPIDQRVKLMLVFPIDDDDVANMNKTNDVTLFLRTGHEHTVVSRTLSSQFCSLIDGERVRYMICPAYFNEDNAVVVYKPEYITDWIYKKKRVTAKTVVKSLRMSRYKQVSLDVSLQKGSDAILLDSDAIFYSIYENNSNIGIYPVDDRITSGNYSIYIRKNQEVRFIVDENHRHKYEIVIEG